LGAAEHGHPKVLLPFYKDCGTPWLCLMKDGSLRLRVRITGSGLSPMHSGSGACF